MQKNLNDVHPNVGLWSEQPLKRDYSNTMQSTYEKYLCVRSYSLKTQRNRYRSFINEIR